MANGRGAMISTGTLLGGRVRYDQFTDGYRTGIEPVLLAAAIPAKPDDRVIEAGAGAGAALLCLAARVDGLQGTGIERDADLAALATRNAAANGFASLCFIAAAIESYRATDPFDHAMANPPWHDAGGTASANPGRAQAKRAAPTLLPGWVAALAACLRPRGTLTLILPAAQTDRAIAALTASGCGGITLIPLWPHAGEPARLALLHARRGGRAAFALRPGLILHRADGAYTDAADDLLRGGTALPP